MSKQEKKGLVPVLRFPEFRDTDGWKIKPFKKIFTRVRARNLENNQNVLTISAQQGLVSQLDYFNKSVAAKDVTGYYLLHKGDFAYNKSYSQGYPMGAIKLLKHYEKGVVSTLYICFKVNDGIPIDFFEQYFDMGIFNSEIEKIAQEGARNHGLLNVGVQDFFKETKLFIPEQKEQQKIADCLSSIDELITAQGQKLDTLKEHKKALMQQLFPAEGETEPRVRFPDYRNSNIWQEKKLGSICKFVRGPFGGSLKKEIFVQEGYAVYEQTHAIYQNFKSFRYYISEEKFNELKRFAIQPNEIIMSCSGTMGKFAIIPKNAKAGIINQALLKLSVKKDYYLRFIKASLEHSNNQEKLLSQSAGGAIKNVVAVGQIKEIPLLIPDKEEQQKISDCLSSIEELITAQAQTLEALKDHKKGLMQQLFPAIDEAAG